MKNNNKSGFTSVEIMLVVCAIVVTMYVVGPAVKAAGAAIGRAVARAEQPAKPQPVEVAIVSTPAAAPAAK
jgi:competence protein ComGC